MRQYCQMLWTRVPNRPSVYYWHSKCTAVPPRPRSMLDVEDNHGEFPNDVIVDVLEPDPDKRSGFQIDNEPENIDFLVDLLDLGK